MERQVEWHIQELEDDENSVKHRQTDEEYAFYNAVSHGDLAAVRQNCDFCRFADKRGVSQQPSSPGCVSGMGCPVNRHSGSAIITFSKWTT